LTLPDPLLLTTAYQWDQRQKILFGGLPVPIFGTTMPFVDLNDMVSWRALSLKVDNGHVQNAASQFAWRAKGVWTAQDFVGRKIHVPCHYYEVGAGVAFSLAKSKLTQSGEQYLSFDGVTGIRVRCNSFTEFDLLDGFPEKPSTSSSQPSYAYVGTLEFLSRNPFAEDMAVQTTGNFSIAGTSGAGAYTNVTINYYGHAFGSPKLTVTVPNGASGKVQKIGWSNVTSGEDIILDVSSGGGLAAGGGHTIIIDSDNSVITVDGVLQAPGGAAFPLVYANAASSPPAVNQMQVWFLSDIASPTNLTGNITWYSKYEF